MTTPEPTLRDQIAEALRARLDVAPKRPTLDGPPGRTEVLVGMTDLADAVLPVVEAAMLAVTVDATRRAEKAERERDSVLEVMPALDTHVVLFDPNTDPCVDWCPKCLHERAEEAEARLRQYDTAIAGERRARLAAQAAVRRVRELADNAEMTADVIDPTGERIQYAAVAVRDLRAALGAEQPKQAPRRLTEQQGGIPNDAYTADDYPKGM